MSTRALCLRCARPERNCICALAQRVDCAAEVLILQHPLEVHEAKGTARLLHLSLPRSRLEIGEQFDAQLLQAWLEQDWNGSASSPAPRSVLLYPESTHDPALPLVPAPPLPADWLAEPARLRLVVIDGTWRKSRKMLYLNPLLQQLPRLALQELPASRYAIRRAHRPGQLSTLEAACCALAQLEPANPELGRLLQAMDALVLREQQWRSPV
ncbi:tRNA-uridine aminocarboxypropyltransferase [Comamonas endophytica]|uniref:tRNA-uridine aminocarboxypropyltransferase n=1 Tax=Comamonas endophytica TaxID=2949090 RepID=A0ABY6G7L7_9BURK|nr:MULTISPECIES: tRNA-uridine aminocarboxypropyltransferase [unclassified Acidovorax]MCD2511351.1 DTW domain-containing protein [Acidovorax sp. D4N7]UYG50745.1 DTW domain-containing protein [Acidovorax sp. 5MLIR]